MNGRASLGSQSDDPLTLKDEMFGPDLCVWIEQETELCGLRINRAEVSPFVPIAAPASIGQIVHVSLAAMLFTYDMIDFMREEGYARR